MTGFNMPTRIGKGDLSSRPTLFLGTISGSNIYSGRILPKQWLFNAEKSHVRDIFGFRRLSKKKNITTAQIDAAWTPDNFLMTLLDWFYNDEAAKDYFTP